jgi:hypothetical protein
MSDVIINFFMFFSLSWPPTCWRTSLQSLKPIDLLQGDRKKLKMFRLATGLG